MLTIHVTPASEDGTAQDAVTHSRVQHHEFVGELPDQELVLLDADEEYRYPLTSHTVVIEPPAPVDDEPTGTEVPDDLGRTPDEVRAEYARLQAAADRKHADSRE